MVSQAIEQRRDSDRRASTSRDLPGCTRSNTTGLRLRSQARAYRKDLAPPLGEIQRETIAARSRWDCGSITPTTLGRDAASTAGAAGRITSIAVSAASGCDVATIAFWAWTVDRRAR